VLREACAAGTDNLGLPTASSFRTVISASSHAHALLTGVGVTNGNFEMLEGANTGDDNVNNVIGVGWY
jgi:hypothetical protein